MKKSVFSFLTGAIATLLLVGLPVTALAASGTLQIEVSPASVLVDGEVFQPTDVNGNSVMVFTYNGTTYAPLRALAEAYGLEVGYDTANHVATVNKPTQASTTTSDTGYANFEKQWTVTEKPVTNYGNEKNYYLCYKCEKPRISVCPEISVFACWWHSPIPLEHALTSSISFTPPQAAG
jgi:hypothetical protein